MQINSKINNLRVIAFFLFLLATISLIGSLVFNNYLINYKFQHGENYQILKIQDKPGSFFEVECNKKNNFCNKEFIAKIRKLEKNNKISDCFKHEVRNFYVIDNNFFKPDEIFSDFEKGLVLENFKSKKISHITTVIDSKNSTCIKNSISYNIYKFLPFWFEIISNLKLNGISLSSSESINPFIYGETSISNLAKRFPINIIFKSFLYMSSILMIFYWKNYNFLFYKILNIKKNYFFYFGIASAIFLFLHVFFLGSEIDNKIFNKIRRLIIVLFILSELLAQIFLTKQLYKNLNSLNNFCYSKIIKTKIVYIILVSLISLIVIFLLIFYNFTSKVDYILEWNYFLALLIFYFLSYLMWKKIN